MVENVHERVGTTVIRRQVLAAGEPIGITRERYDAIVAGKKALLRMVALEEKFSLIIDNYAEYERALLDLTLSRTLDVDYNYSTLHDGRHLLNRRLANLLTAAKMYVDQVDRDVKSVCGTEAAADETKAARSVQYDGRFGYRVMEALRNHVQHHGLPIGSMKFPSTRVEREGRDPLLRHGIIVSLDVGHLEGNGDFKARVLSELRQRAESQKPGHVVPITPLVREYIEGLAAVHAIVREKTGPAVDAAEATIAGVIEEAKSAWGTSVGLGISAAESEDEWIETHDVFPELAERRRSLAYKTRHLGVLTSLYVTSETID